MKITLKNSSKNSGQNQEGKKGKRSAIVIHPNIIQKGESNRMPEAKLEEIVNLTAAIDLEVKLAKIYNIKNVKPATILGQGAIDEIATYAKDSDIDVVIVDTNLTPIQQRNLEKKLDAKVIDRTGLILEIFGERAKTKEGEYQVELAALKYQRSRLVRSWTHLERQRGGLGFIGGPGESQLEIDRRLIDERIKKIKKDLEKVKLTRGLHRKARSKVPYPIIALVGYTNAGKSTLFNQMTNERVMAKDMLFATLDPTMLKVKLSGGKEIILSDTVGFISELPTLLVEAFKATLEEVLSADIIIHVMDISHPDHKAQHDDVITVLNELGIDIKEYKEKHRYIEVLNKMDLVKNPEDLPKNLSKKIKISAIKGEGITDLMDEIAKSLSKINKEHKYEIEIAPEISGPIIAKIHQKGKLLEVITDDEGKDEDKQADKEKIKIVFKMSKINYEKMRKSFNI